MNLTKDQKAIVSLLLTRKGTRPARKFWLEITGTTGMKISYTHLVNVLNGNRTPDHPALLAYLGKQKVEQYQDTPNIPVRGRK